MPYCCKTPVECAICLECIDREDADTKLCELKCAHCFHQKCMDKWLEFGSTCPVCRCTINNGVMKAVTRVLVMIAMNPVLSLCNSTQFPVVLHYLVWRQWARGCFNSLTVEQQNWLLYTCYLCTCVEDFRIQACCILSFGE